MCMHLFTHTHTHTRARRVHSHPATRLLCISLHSAGVTASVDAPSSTQRFHVSIGFDQWSGSKSINAVVTRGAFCRIPVPVSSRETFKVKWHSVKDTSHQRGSFKQQCMKDQFIHGVEPITKFTACRYDTCCCVVPVGGILFQTDSVALIYYIVWCGYFCAIKIFKSSWHLNGYFMYLNYMFDSHETLVHEFNVKGHFLWSVFYHVELVWMNLICLTWDWFDSILCV